MILKVKILHIEECCNTLEGKNSFNMMIKCSGKMLTNEVSQHYNVHKRWKNFRVFDRGNISGIFFEFYCQKHEFGTKSWICHLAAIGTQFQIA